MRSRHFEYTVSHQIKLSIPRLHFMEKIASDLIDEIYSWEKCLASVALSIVIRYSGAKSK